MSLPEQVKNLFGKQLLLLWFKLVSYHSTNGLYCHIFKTCNANITTGRSECHALRGIYVQRTSQRCQPQVLPWRGSQVFGFNRPTKMCSIRTYKMKKQVKVIIRHWRLDNSPIIPQNSLPNSQKPTTIFYSDVEPPSNLPCNVTMLHLSPATRIANHDENPATSLSTRTRMWGRRLIDRRGGGWEIKHIGNTQSQAQIR